MWGYLVGGLVVLASAVYTQRSAARTSRRTEAARAAMAAVRADGEAYDRAMAINKDIVEGLREEVGRLQVALAELRLQFRAEETRSAALEVKIANLQQSVNRMTALLAENKIPIPTWSD